MPTKLKNNKQLPSDGKKNAVTIKDIAAELGISFQAVSQALNPRPNTSKVSEATRQRIVETATRLNYRGHPAARILRSSRSGLLGVLIFDHPHQVMHYRLHHVLAEIHRVGYRPFVHLADTRPNSGAQDGCMTMLDARVEGLVLVDPIGFPEESPIEQLLAQDIPIVSLGSHQWRSITSFQADRYQGYQDLTHHLLEAGCRSLTLLLAAAIPSYRLFFRRFLKDMTKGFQDAISGAEVSLGPLAANIHTVELPMHWEETEGQHIHPIYRSGYLGMQQILAGGKLPDAVLCQADCWAQGALRACYEAGLNVPEDILLTGFGNEPGSSAGRPPNTTIAQPFAELSRRAIQDVVRQIQGTKKNTPGKVVTVPGELIIRDSSLKIARPQASVKNAVSGTTSCHSH